MKGDALFQRGGEYNYSESNESLVFYHKVNFIRQKLKKEYTCKNS